MKIKLLLLLLATISPCFAQQVQQWSPWLRFGEDLFPSYAISTATMHLKRPTPNLRGDVNGAFGIQVSVTAPTVLIAEISCKKFFAKSGLKVTLPKPGTYVLCPTLNYDFDALYSAVEPEPTTVSFRLLDQNGKQISATTQRITVRSINDCIWGFKSGDGSFTDWSVLFAAYVNENHPWVDRILQTALKKKLVDSFIGYQGTPEDVVKQVRAIWTVLQGMGIKYSSITTTSGVSSVVLDQHVRFFDDSIQNTQANCVDGSVLMAAIFRKIGLKTFLVLVPGHCFLGVYDDVKANTAFEIETTMIGTGASLEQARRTGSARYDKEQKKFGRVSGYALVDIDDARANGIQPLKSRRSVASSKK